MDFLTDPIFSDFGRSDFIGGIDNEALDFGQLEQFIHVASGAEAAATSDGVGGGVIGPVAGNETELKGTRSSNGVGVTATQSHSHLPESPPDSGSEPPYSPADLHVINLPPDGPTGAATDAVSSVSANGDGANSASTGGITINRQLAIMPQMPIGHNIAATLTDLTGVDGPAHLHTMLSTHHLNPPQSHHHHHHTHPLGGHQQHHHPQALYNPSSTTIPIPNRSDLSLANDEHGSLGIIRKHEGAMQLMSTSNSSSAASSDSAIQQIITDGAANILDYRNDLGVMGLGPSSVDDLSRLMPEVVYGTAHMHQHTAGASRKRKLSQPLDNIVVGSGAGDPPSIKPEPVASLSPMYQHQQKIEPSSPVSTNLQQPPPQLHHHQIGSPTSSSSSHLSVTSSSSSSKAHTLSNGNNGAASSSCSSSSAISPTGGGGGGSTSDPDCGGQNPADSSDSCPMQCIRFSPFQQQNWHILCDQSLQELPIPNYRVDADKGFNFSNSDDAFVCQKKNHFQITCHAQLQGDAAFVRTPTGLEKIKSFHLHFYGVKLEAPNQTIRVEQSQSDRSKKPFHPVPIDLQNRLVSKVTVGRLHFSETTSNNMRKKGRPNPEQRYFQLIVGLHAHTHSGHFPIVSQGSERIIVRASNPGQFESDVELCWQRGITQDSIYHAGRVGINTDRPDESLVIHGNLKVSGHIVQPSDSRAKQEITELDTAEQLRNLQKIRIVRYRYEPEFAAHSGLTKANSKTGENDSEDIIDTGVIAQELRQVLPDAVQEAGSIVLPSGQVIENFLLVNKDRILMENIGAVKELCKVTGSLETRIEQLEKINTRLMRIQQVDRNHNCSSKKCKHLFDEPTTLDDDEDDDSDELCSNKTIQLIIIVLVIIMAICLAAISTLYFVEHNKQRFNFKRYDRLDIRNHAILINNHNHNNGYYSGAMANYTAVGNNDHHRDTESLLHNGATRGDDKSSLSSSGSELPPDDPVAMATGGAATTLDHLSFSSANSKAANSKNKSKWPAVTSSSSASVSIISLTSPHSATPMLVTPLPGKNFVGVGSNINDNLTTSETSSEKIAGDTISSLPQDVENNSIDGDSLSGQVKLSESTKSSIIAGATGIESASDGNVVRGTVGVVATDEASVSVSHGISANRARTNVSVNQQVELTNDAPTITNKSRADTEEVDLQNLSSNSEADDQGIFEIGPSTAPHQTVIVKSVVIQPIGLPEHCELIEQRNGDRPECQSVCCEDNINCNLQSSAGHQVIENDHQQFEQQSFVGLDHNETEAITQGPKTSSVLIKSSTYLTDEQPIDADDVIKPIKLSDTKRKATATATSNSNERSHRSKSMSSSSSDCFQIRPWIRSDVFNVSLGTELICANRGHNFNMSISIPLSKYMRQTNVELYFMGSNTLQWIACNIKEKTNRIGREITSNLNNGKLFQKNPNKSIFYLIIPNHGYFERSFELRASLDSNKNICQQDQHDTKNNLFQYNIRIFRDCD